MTSRNNFIDLKFKLRRLQKTEQQSQLEIIPTEDLVQTEIRHLK